MLVPVVRRRGCGYDSLFAVYQVQIVRVGFPVLVNAHFLFGERIVIRGREGVRIGIIVIFVAGQKLMNHKRKQDLVSVGMTLQLIEHGTSQDCVKVAALLRRFVPNQKGGIDQSEIEGIGFFVLVFNLGLFLLVFHKGHVVLALLDERFLAVGNAGSGHESIGDGLAMVFVTRASVGRNGQSQTDLGGYRLIKGSFVAGEPHGREAGQ